MFLSDDWIFALLFFWVVGIKRSSVFHSANRIVAVFRIWTQLGFSDAGSFGFYGSGSGFFRFWISLVFRIWIRFFGCWIVVGFSGIGFLDLSGCRTHLVFTDLDLGVFLV